MEERITNLERNITDMQSRYDESIGDLNYHVTMLLGLTTSATSSIRDIKSSLRSVDHRLDLLENHAAHFDARLTRIESRLDGIETGVSEQKTMLAEILARLPAKEN